MSLSMVLVACAGQVYLAGGYFKVMMDLWNGHKYWEQQTTKGLKRNPLYTCKLRELENW